MTEDRFQPDWPGFCIVALWVALVTALLLTIGCASGRGFPATAGIVNFDRVDSRVFRGGQPTAEGLDFLRGRGVRSVLCLCLPTECAPGESNRCAELGMRWTWLPLPGASAPTRKQIELALLSIDQGPGPVYVHCVHGCDRTGTVIACYRIRHGWGNAGALREAEVYGLSPWEWGMRRFIRNWK